MKPRPIADRLQDRLWSMRSNRAAIDLPMALGKEVDADSISGVMAWPKACAALAAGTIRSTRFRRLRAVMEVVETLGPCDGRHHARVIRAAGNAAWLERSEFLSLAAWGDPFLWPSVLLGTEHAIAPTSLRYLSHALWLHDEGLVGQNAKIAEIGVGYGGLAALNTLVSEACTTLVDLPHVEQAAMKMLTENGIDRAATPSPRDEAKKCYDCVISNYAFTELSRDLQDRMLTHYMVGSGHGMILSNAGVFSQRIGGRTNDEILSALGQHGIQARCHSEHPLLSPSDQACGSVLIQW